MFRVLRDLYDPFDYRYGLASPSSMLEDYYSPPHLHLKIIRPREQSSSGLSLKQGGKQDPNKFQVMLNVKHFRPDEIDVKTVDNCIVVRGKHEEHADEHGFVSREFTRRYPLPDDVEAENVTSSLSQDGVLTIQAPRKAVEPPKNERVVPITIQQSAAVEEAQKQQQMQQDQSAPQGSGDQ